MQITQELKDLICSRFLEGEFLSRLSQKYKIPKVWLVSFLEEKGINPSRLGLRNGRLSQDKRQEIVDLYKSGLKMSDIAKEINLGRDTISTYLKRMNIDRRVRGDYNNIVLDFDYFEKIDTSNKAYYLGFIAADGYNNKSKLLEITLHPKDKQQLENFVKEIKSNRPITIKKGKYVYLGIFSKRFMSHLETHGIVPRKSLVLKYPTTVPKEFQKDFDRGYFDGDGYISKDGKKIEIVGTQDILLGIAESIFQSVKVNPSTIMQKGPVWRMFYSGAKKTAKIYAHFYADSITFLERKHLRFNNNKYISK